MGTELELRWLLKFAQNAVFPKMKTSSDGRDLEEDTPAAIPAVLKTVWTTTKEIRKKNFNTNGIVRLPSVKSPGSLCLLISGKIPVNTAAKAIPWY